MLLLLNEHGDPSFVFQNLRSYNICTIFIQCIDGFSLLKQTNVRKGNDVKNSAILSFSFVNKRARINAAHA